MTLAATGEWFVFTPSSSANKNRSMPKSLSTGTLSDFMVQAENATIELLQITTTTGSIESSMPKTVLSVEDFDEIDADIALMSDQELIEAVLASAGSWADRDDLDFILDRTDRIDDLYASIKPDNPDTPI